MQNTSGQTEKHICAALLAHVDAGKTTLSESLLYTAGSIRKLGKVDTKDAFLDTNALERARGITIFSKQARFTWKDTRVTLLDTPGHVDFSAEMERVLGVLDYAVLLISASDGVQGHTQTLWELLMQYDVPVFLFINKMDQPGTDREKILSELKIRLDSGCVDFTDVTSESCQEDIAACEEETMEQYFETGEVTEGQIRRLIWERKLFPCFFWLRPAGDRRGGVFGCNRPVYTGDIRISIVWRAGVQDFPGSEGRAADTSEDHRRRPENESAADQSAHRREKDGGYLGREDKSDPPVQQ